MQVATKRLSEMFRALIETIMLSSEATARPRSKRTNRSSREKTGDGQRVVRIAEGLARIAHAAAQAEAVQRAGGDRVVDEQRRQPVGHLWQRVALLPGDVGLGDLALAARRRREDGRALRQALPSHSMPRTRPSSVCTWQLAGPHSVPFGSGMVRFCWVIW